MGIHNFPDFVQAEMERVLQGSRTVEVYIEDVAIFGTGNDEDHSMKDVVEVLH